MLAGPAVGSVTATLVQSAEIGLPPMEKVTWSGLTLKAEARESSGWSVTSAVSVTGSPAVAVVGLNVSRVDVMSQVTSLWSPEFNELEVFQSLPAVGV